MIRHYLRLVQPNVWKMVRYGTPAFIHDTPQVVQVDPCINAMPHDRSE